MHDDWKAPGPDMRRLYADLAWIWPLISPPEDYRDEAEEFTYLFKTYCAGPVRSVLHLGCGAGHLDSHLKKTYQLTGVDLSAPMLARARRLNPLVGYIQGDMRSIRLARTFDAVILADASDYLLSRADLEATFTTAYRLLRPGGIFCTYAEEILGRFEQNRTRFTRHVHGEIEITSIENMYDPDPHDTVYEMTFLYLIRQAGALSIEVDRHLTGIYTNDEWIAALSATGFQVEMVEYETTGPGFIGRKGKKNNPGQDPSLDLPTNM